MEPTEPKQSAEPFPGYNEMPNEYKGEIGVVFYLDPDGYYLVQQVMPSSNPAEMVSPGDSPNFRRVAEFRNVSAAFVKAANAFVTGLSQKRARGATKVLPSITWRDIIQR